MPGAAEVVDALVGSRAPGRVANEVMKQMPIVGALLGIAVRDGAERARLNAAARAPVVGTGGHGSVRVPLHMLVPCISLANIYAVRPAESVRFR